MKTDVLALETTLLQHGVTPMIVAPANDLPGLNRGAAATTAA